MYQTYILYSKSTDQYYTGHTSVGVDVRLQHHNDGWTRSTKNGIPWRLCYYMSFNSKTEAIKKEKFIKRQKSRVFIEKLIISEENEFKLA